jgi:hypothetical protein
MLRNVLASLAIVGTLAVPAVASGKATTKSNTKAIKKLQHDVAIVSQRQKDTQAQLDVLTSCLSAFPSDMFMLPGVNGEADQLVYGLSDAPVFWVVLVDEACLVSTQGSLGRAHLHLPR